jgi:hypothetical protein
MFLAMAISPDNTPHGYNLTFAFPMLMFIIVATVLFLRFRSSHRVPGHVALTSSRWAQRGSARPGTAPEQSTTNGSTLQEDAGQEVEVEGPAEETTEGSE